MNGNAAASIAAPKALVLAQKLANMSDTAVRIPFTKVKFGLDFIIGLIPGIGDMVMLIVGAVIIILGKSIGLPGPLILKMLKNSVIDFVLGLVPFIGDIADIFYKSNQSNVRIMERWWLSQNKAAIDAHTQQTLANWQDTKNEDL
ncbi:MULTISPECIES: DUF4112 domain-containing protein [Alteromonadaceae]|uniref:DUF4112 domain-containing protein n=1 Tax=Alteromonadaceae TaxID=72275 RepID=UPI001C084A6C|nr:MULTISPECIES: DUF4112 domain-containing protein [Aliiglaciecola]MBU2879510.1 DUF4112 domain-containing protein [Aliiglaciecola lipolytica]MDO6712569.1 DUF4112 domain-containing protein [Aliiglaciecola sp. 2_MG-2023]MDO6753687.1 DUF4112 domain-containing protein [Aliiglaciecola sp. 1_MG-2023]